MIHKQNVGLPNDYSLGRHFETKHSNFNENYLEDFRKQEIASLVQALKVQQSTF
jgi:hypothetical protein